MKTVMKMRLPSGLSTLHGMTAEWSKIPHEILAEISSEIINKVKGINRLVYDISTKPPATFEWSNVAITLLVICGLISCTTSRRVVEKPPTPTPIEKPTEDKVSQI